MNNSGYKKNKIKSDRPKLLKDDEYKKILEHSYNGEIDINWIINNLNISKSTAYRTMQELNLTHASESTINIIKEYINGSSTEELSKKYNCTTVNIRNLLKRRNIKIRKSRYFANFRYFNKIDTEFKAYILGFIYADGNLFNNTLKIAISEKDKEILEKFKEDIKCNNPILFIKSNLKNRQDQVSLSITDVDLRNDLIDKGVIENKTFKIVFPSYNKVPKKLIHHFIRGYFDGDGCICVYKVKFIRNNHKYINTKCCINIVGTEQFLTELKKILENNNIKCNSKLYKRHKERFNNIRTLVISGKQNCKSFYKFAYKDSNVFLSRKYERFKNIN